MKNDDRDNKYWQAHSLNLFAKLSAWIVFPVILAVIIGKWLDALFGTEPWLLFLSVGISFVISIGGMVVISLREIEKIEEEKKKK